jgi:hypothetical protein
MIDIARRSLPTNCVRRVFFFISLFENLCVERTDSDLRVDLAWKVARAPMKASEAAPGRHLCDYGTGVRGHEDPRECDVGSFVR